MEASEFDIRESGKEKEKDIEKALRPLCFDDFAGQNKIIANLRIFVQAAKMRGEALDHTLLHGPPGLGKTTLSNIVANELGVGFKVTSGPVLDKPGDLAGILMSLEPHDVLFIDEIHRKACSSPSLPSHSWEPPPAAACSPPPCVPASA